MVDGNHTSHGNRLSKCDGVVPVPGVDGDALPVLDLHAVIAGNRRVALKLVRDPEPDFDLLLQGAVFTGEHGKGNGDGHPHPDS